MEDLKVHGVAPNGRSRSRMTIRPPEKPESTELPMRTSNALTTYHDVWHAHRMFGDVLADLPADREQKFHGNCQVLRSMAKQMIAGIDALLEHSESERKKK